MGLSALLAMRHADEQRGVDPRAILAGPTIAQPALVPPQAAWVWPPARPDWDEERRRFMERELEAQREAAHKLLLAEAEPEPEPPRPTYPAKARPNWRWRGSAA